MLILITGLPGSGKSTVARLLAEMIEAHVINSDVIRRELFPHERTYSSQETQTVIRKSEQRVTDLLAQGKTVIQDALFTKQRSRDAHRELAERQGVPFVVVHVTASEETTRRRLEIRSKTGDASEATFDYYLDRKTHFEPIEGEHFSIENSGDLKTLERQVEFIAEAISDTQQPLRE